MIVLRWKPLEKTRSFVAGAEKLLVVGCRGCATVCSAGGEKEAEEMARLLDLAARAEGRPLRIGRTVVERQCDREFLEPLRDHPLLQGAPPSIQGVGGQGGAAVLSLACGAGVQLLGEVLSGREVFPAADTVFIGVAESKGTWGERCQACGDCKLHLTAGICPVSRCSKSLLNGPCGGSTGGHCEIDAAVPCAWQLIVERLEAQGRLDDFEKILEPADWSTARDGGPRKLVREDLT